MRYLIAAIVFVIVPAIAFAQWPENPWTNMVISDAPGQQTLPKISATSDGGFYISWYSTQSGNYDVYLQRLNVDGYTQWPANGILINDHPQETWITDYDMATDQEDHAIIVVNDIRNGVDRDIYAYRISPAGVSVWGPDGLTISANDGFEPDPQVEITSAGNIAIAWQEDSLVHIRKLTPQGQDCWSNPSVITLHLQYGLSIPRIAAADSDAIIVQALVQMGPNYWSPKYLYAFKISADGQHLWNPQGVPINTAGGYGPQMKPEIIPDGRGGAISYWYDTRSMDHHVYAQHLSASGTPSWAANGVNVCLTSARLQMSPSACFDVFRQRFFVFYLATDLNQTIFGVGGQMLDSSGYRRWGNDGVTAVPLNSQGKIVVNCLPVENGAIVVYAENPIGSTTIWLVKAIRVDSNGAAVWPLSPVILSSIASGKMHFHAANLATGRIVTGWSDSRFNAEGDLYIQNVNPDGSLGPGGTSIDEKGEPFLPNTIELLAGYPNPFNSTTTIKYFLAQPSTVTLSIYDILGHQVFYTMPEHKESGFHVLRWEAGDFVSGLYFARLSAAGQSHNCRLILLK